MHASRPMPSPTVPDRPLSSHRHPHRLRLEISVQGIPAQISSEPRGLESPEGRAGIVAVVAVDPDGPRPNGSRRAVRLLDVPGPDARGKAIHRPVREANTSVE